MRQLAYGNDQQPEMDHSPATPQAVIHKLAGGSLHACRCLRYLQTSSRIQHKSALLDVVAPILAALKLIKHWGVLPAIAAPRNITRRGDRFWGSAGRGSTTLAVAAAGAPRRSGP
jgi:hypothetical protein